MSDKLETVIKLMRILPSERQAELVEQISRIVLSHLNSMIDSLGVECQILPSELAKREKTKVIAKAEHNTEKKRNYRRNWDVHGRKFPTIQKLCDFYGISENKLRYRMNKKHEELEDIVPNINKPNTLVTKIKRTDKNGEIFTPIN